MVGSGVVAQGQVAAHTAVHGLITSVKEDLDGLAAAVDDLAGAFSSKKAWLTRSVTASVDAPKLIDAAIDMRARMDAARRSVDELKVAAHGLALDGSASALVQARLGALETVMRAAQQATDGAERSQRLLLADPQLDGRSMHAYDLTEALSTTGFHMRHGTGMSGQGRVLMGEIGLDDYQGWTKSTAHADTIAQQLRSATDNFGDVVDRAVNLDQRIRGAAAVAQAKVDARLAAIHDIANGPEVQALQQQLDAARQVEGAAVADVRALLGASTGPQLAADVAIEFVANADGRAAVAAINAG